MDDTGVQTLKELIYAGLERETLENATVTHRDQVGSNVCFEISVECGERKYSQTVQFTDMYLAENDGNVVVNEAQHVAREITASISTRYDYRGRVIATRPYEKPSGECLRCSDVVTVESRNGFLTTAPTKQYSEKQRSLLKMYLLEYTHQNCSCVSKDLSDGPHY